MHIICKSLILKIHTDMVGRTVHGQFLRNRRRTNILAYIYFFRVNRLVIAIHSIYTRKYTNVYDVKVPIREGR